MARTLGSLRRTRFAPLPAEVSSTGRGSPPPPADSTAARPRAVPRPDHVDRAVQACGLDGLTPRPQPSDAEQRGALDERSAFAAGARRRAGPLAPLTAPATRVLCGVEPHKAAAITQDVRPPGTATGPLSAYERRRVTAERITR